MFIIFKARQAFTKLKQAFIKTPILNYFDLEYQIRIETDVSNYAISEIFCQLTSNNLGQWHLVAFIFRKIILIETQYKIYNGKLLAIIKVFKI